MFPRRLANTGMLLLGLFVGLPTAADAQSAIAGVVRDTTGAVLPGVTVEATSPALIEKTRSVVTDNAGMYRVVDLRPGTYTVTFTLVGFSTVKREGIQLEANFTAPVNVEMRVGTVEETVTVTGQSPIVDVQNTQRREVLTREVLDALPTGRNYQTIGNTLPSVTMGRFDVAGSTAMQQGTVAAYGGLGGDMSMEVDGMSVTSMLSTGSVPAVYHNDDAYQEYVFQVSGGTAESQTGGVRINMIPKQGGNQFKGDAIAVFSNTDLQGENVNDTLRTRGLTTPAALYRLYDVNGSLGGPIKRDRLWFFTSIRVWAYNAFVANAFNPDGSQAVDDNKIEAYTNRLTYQINQKNKVTALYDKLPKFRGHRELEFGGVEPKATVVQTVPLGYNGQVKWTSTATNKLLLEAGYSTNFYGFKLAYQPEVKRATCSAPFNACPAGTDYGDISKVDIIRNTRRNAALQDFWNPFVAYNIVGAVSYVTGSHAFKTGIQYRWGWIKAFRNINGDLIQQYRNGLPDSVQVRNTPLASESRVNADLGLYVQDSWTIGRLTLNPGLRFEYLNGEVPEQNSPAGRFVPARHFDRIPNLPNWKNVVPRFGAAYDLFGNSKTAIKGSVGKFMQQELIGFAEKYNPLILSTDTRTWNDLNGDDIAQENELGPSTNRTFGIRRNINPDPNLKRPFQILYNVGIQHELWTGLSVSATYYRRRYYDLFYTTNLAVPHSAYTLITIPDPRGNGQTLPVYNLDRSFFGLVNELDTTSPNNKRTYNGIDIMINARLRNGSTLSGGTSTGRTRSTMCDVPDPNQVRYCDETQYHIPRVTTLKLSGSYPLPYSFRFSGVFQSTPGFGPSPTAAQAPLLPRNPDSHEKLTVYAVNRAIVPTLTQTSVGVLLDPPGANYMDRVTQLDLSIARIFRVRSVQVKPQLDLFNALNVSPVVSQVNTFGSSLGRPLRVLDARLLRLGVQLEF